MGPARTPWVKGPRAARSLDPFAHMLCLPIGESPTICAVQYIKLIYCGDCFSMQCARAAWHCSNVAHAGRAGLDSHSHARSGTQDEPFQKKLSGLGQHDATAPLTGADDAMQLVASLSFDAESSL